MVHALSVISQRTEQPQNEAATVHGEPVLQGDSPCTTAEPTTATMRDGEYPEDSEVGAPRVVHNHYSQSKNGSGDKTNTILLAALLAIVGFVGIQVWIMNGRMAAFEATLTLLVQRSGIANPPQ